MEEAAEQASDLGGSHGQMTEEFIDQMFVLFGSEILKVVPGRVSTEVAASSPGAVGSALQGARKHFGKGDTAQSFTWLSCVRLPTFGEWQVRKACVLAGYRPCRFAVASQVHHRKGLSHSRLFCRSSVSKP